MGIKMGLNFKQILKEENSPKHERFIKMVVDKMMDHFVDKYGGDNHWVVNANWMEHQDVRAYRWDVEKSKSLNEEITILLGKLKNVGRYTPKQIQKLWDTYYEKSQEYVKSMNRVNHIGRLFDPGISQGTEFVEKLAVPTEILLSAWEKFYEEIYKPGKIEYNKTSEGLGLEHGLDDGNHTDIGAYGGGRYHVMKDNDTNEFILVINQSGSNWAEDGMNYDDIYYKRLKTSKEVKDIIEGLEFKSLMNDLYGAEVDYGEGETRDAYEFLLDNDVRLKEIADEDYEGDMKEALADRLVWDLEYEENRNQWGSDILSLSGYLLKFYETIKSLNF